MPAISAPIWMPRPGSGSRLPALHPCHTLSSTTVARAMCSMISDAPVCHEFFVILFVASLCICPGYNACAYQSCGGMSYLFYSQALFFHLLISLVISERLLHGYSSPVNGSELHLSCRNYRRPLRRMRRFDSSYCACFVNVLFLSFQECLLTST